MRTQTLVFRAAVAAVMIFSTSSCGWKTDGAAILSEQYHQDLGQPDVPEDVPADTAATD